MLNHMIAFAAGFILDFIIGDPYNLPHPIRLIGNMIGALDKKWNSTDPDKADKGSIRLVLTVTISTFVVTALVLILAYMIHPVVGIIVEAVLSYYVLAARCLEKESMKVYKKAAVHDLEGARYAVSMIVGRDTNVLDETGVIKAAVETVAENTSDGVIAPMIYTAIGGPALGLLYKSINTMDSMVGYKNDKYLHFGRKAAKLDDVVNYLPARISAYLMMLACCFLGKDYDGKNAHRIFKRDRYKHASPNSAQTESTCAGALHIQLAGDAVYFGKVHKKEFIGDPDRPVENEDIKRANHLMYMTALLCELICLGLMALTLL